MILSDKEKQILDSIKVASHNDPLNPEFPLGSPCFPASETYQIDVPGFTNVWLKDESSNLTGTHKDRMAREIIVTYKDFLLAKESGLTSGSLPQMSIISSGSAALAIQVALRHYGLPNLKTLVDHTTKKSIITAMEHVGVEVYATDLSQKRLTAGEILQLTNNPQGIDITSGDALNPDTRFYDRLGYEIINSSPNWCFMPFGTGALYENTLNVLKNEASNHTGHDPRFQGEINILRQCHFMGAGTNNPNTQAIKLYSPHLPFSHFSQQWLSIYKISGFCGNKSNVLLIRESSLDTALSILHGQGIAIEPSAAAGLALLLQMKDEVPKNDKILIVSTGKTKYNDTES